MPFTISEFEDLLQILQQHPEWRTRLLETLLGEEFLTLPHHVQLLIQAQQRTDEQLTALAAEVRALAEEQRQLAEAQRRTDERLEQLAARYERWQRLSVVRTSDWNS